MSFTTKYNSDYFRDCITSNMCSSVDLFIQKKKFIETITKYRARQVISAGGRGEKVIEKSVSLIFDILLNEYKFLSDSKFLNDVKINIIGEKSQLSKEILNIII